MKNQLLNLFIGASLCSLFIAPCSSFAQVPNYVPTNGLVGYWPFNGNANDESGNGNNGTVNGATLTTDRFGVPNKAYSINGISNISLNNVSLNNITKYSYAGWFKKSSATINQGANLISMSNPCNGPGGLRLEIGDNNQFCFGAEFQSCSSVWKYSQNQNYSDNTWHFFAAVYDGNIGQIQSSEFILYIDGVLIPQSPINQGNTANVIAPINNLGVTALIGGFSSIIRDVDDIGIWNRALTQCEIQDLYHAQLNSAAGISAGPDQTVCEGEFITLNGSGGTNYVWNNSVVDGVPFIPTASMDYPVLGQDANGCIGTDTMHVELIPTSSSTLTETALDSYTLNGQTYTQSGTYTQVIPNAAGCDSTITLNLSLDFTGISELNKEFRIAPNPATDQLIISTNTLSNEKYILFDPQGRQVLSGFLTGTTTQLDLSKLARGNYLLQIGEKLTPVKLVKE